MPKYQLDIIFIQVGMVVAINHAMFCVDNLIFTMGRATMQKTNLTVLILTVFVTTALCSSTVLAQNSDT
jgi:hypothetical protein